jgi:hypothetical protein
MGKCSVKCAYYFPSVRASNEVLTIRFVLADRKHISNDSSDIVTQNLLYDSSANIDSENGKCILEHNRTEIYNVTSMFGNLGFS